ncbi:MAG: NADH-quinone oxidoreductase subunit C [Candidatus Theseobacter exili]|nr:NADH-quinone oxidoreductase subunit C [Candidatus Theseobacter exili]
MNMNQEIKELKENELISNVSRLFKEGYRLVQISCSKSDKLQLDYSFDKEYFLLNLRLFLSLENPEVQSITDIYWSAFTYENELHDLFGIHVREINVDFKGNFYRIQEDAPFLNSDSIQHGGKE